MENLKRRRAGTGVGGKWGWGKDASVSHLCLRIASRIRLKPYIRIFVIRKSRHRLKTQGPHVNLEVDHSSMLRLALSRGSSIAARAPRPISFAPRARLVLEFTRFNSNQPFWNAPKLTYEQIKPRTEQPSPVSTTIRPSAIYF